MNKLLILLSFVILSIYSCSSDTDVNKANVNTSKAQAEVAALFDSVHAAMKGQSTVRLNNFLSEKGTYLGTDPAEEWTRDQLTEYLTESFKNQAPYEYTVDKRTIHLHNDNLNATVVEEFMYPALNPKMTIRVIGHATHQEGRWLIDLFAYNLLARNADIPTINKALD